ncbi:hypothetical protein [Poseidonibacter ostreae]|jgi:hypothetical protein|uniref:Uncharacterized protein n=1 Tax=Poseidonibacter ostreae TaxID=2654171 RepID=A0A6L4WV59_9BACT|nr:hypothetical protein [Poseidonibacter ostreae]KAB7881932.1 hypothetical protein GA417_14120 [Poseidonibacter ostreae]KAB7890329.1 hypothetical protein GBG19_03635 [Poseidonibacter ostreae]KAB7890559.1 hypothetical protein GBG18_08510 [Poseidonibacter ostreae]MAC85161.1 hypothetical protein [Arcobacter sp.]|tara:strand:- start:1031 stop:1792 length:762 start_codon:yes stop_codon:yes gene_type:complete
MNYNDFVGFDGNKELLSKDFDTFDSEFKLRQLFLHLSNFVLNSVCTFSKYEQKSLAVLPLKIAFESKIKVLLPQCNIRIKPKNKEFNICINSTNIINNYTSSKTKKLIIVNSKNLLPAAKLISHCFINNKMQLLIDKNLLFHEFVLEKLRKLHKDKEVKDLADSISIKQKDVCALKIYTSWKNIQRKNPNIQNEVDNAIKVINKGEFNQVYLIYPKDNDFTRHIPVFVDELKYKTYQIKAIPYSLRSIIRKNI